MSATVIVYAYKNEFLDKSIDNLLDYTASDNLDKIIICIDKEDLEFARNDVTVIRTNGLGRAKCFNRAVAESKSDHIVFLRAPFKLSNDWLTTLLAEVSKFDQCIISPIVYTLDTSLWCAENRRYKHTTIRWDLNTYQTKESNSNITPITTSYCMLMSKNHFLDINGFDDGMNAGYGEDVELSIKNLSLGGTNIICTKTHIASEFEIDASPHTIKNKMRIAEMWFKSQTSHIYDALNISASNIDTGRYNNYLNIVDKITNRTDDLIKKYFPHLGDIFRLRSIAFGKKMAIVSTSKSLDYINKSEISNHDIIIGIDHAALLLECDYVITDSVIKLADIKTRYSNDKLILPKELENRMLGEYVNTNDVIDVKYQFEYDQKSYIPILAYPPFCDYDNITLTAIHIALFMSPKSITLYGYDTHLIDGKSHMEQGGYYHDGKLLPNTEATQKQFAFCELGLASLSNLAIKLKIPIIKVSHL